MKIAVCDDDRTVIEQLEQYFERLHDKSLEYEVFFCAEELQWYITEQDAAFDVFILDIEMKGISGIDFAKKFREKNVNALIIFMTSYSRYVFDVFETIMLLILPETYSICRALVNDISSNNKEVRVYVYGAMVSVAPNEVLKDIVGLSGVIVGDAEEVIDSMCCENDSNIQNKNNSKIIYGELFDLKKLKNASEALVKYGKVNSHVRINTTNGCLHNCSFCVLNKKYGNGVVNKFTVRDMKDVYNEIIYIYEKHGITSFYINDRNITDAGKQRLFELCSLFENYGVKFTFFAFARADSFNEEDINLLKLMRKNGFIMLDIGIEAGNDSDLSVYNKQISKEKNKEIIKLLERANIGIRINFIMLNPFSTYATLCENYLFLSENKVYIWRNYVSLLKLFFGTQLYKESLKNNLLLEDYSISNVYAYRCNDDFANEYKKYIEWIESEKIDILNNTFKNEKNFGRYFGNIPFK